VVLEALYMAPFEPMESLDLKIFSYKTSLLMALASAKHVGDLHVLSVHPCCTQFAPGQLRVVCHVLFHLVSVGVDLFYQKLTD
jgi:hypothetical protein